MTLLLTKYRSLTVPSVVVVLFLTTLNCTNTSKESSSDITMSEIDDTSWNIKRTNNLYNISTPNQVMKIFGKNLLKYEDGLVHDAQKHKVYLDSKSQALNIGIYMTDAAYLNLFNHTNEAYPYVDAIFELSDEVRISHTLDKDLFNRLRSNVYNKDSLENLTEDIFFNLFNQLVGSPRENMAALITIGCYIEALYLSVESVDEYSPDHTFFSHIEDFYILLEHVYLFVEDNTIDLNVESAFNYIVRIKSILDESEKEVKKVDSEGYTIKTKREISEEQFYRLKKEIQDIRTEIIGIGIR